MNVCHICSNYDSFYIDFMEQQLLEGLDFRVFYFRAKERGLPNVEASYLDVRLNYRNWHRLLFHLKERIVLKDFLNLYENTDFDLYHAHTLFSNGYIALEAKKRWNKPYIVAVRDVDVNVFFKYQIHLRSLGLQILNEAEKIVYLSESYLDLMNSKYIPENLQAEFSSKSSIIPNGINSFFLKNKYYRDELDEQSSLNIITVGYLSKRKNQLAVCEAIKSLNESGIKTTYTVIGKVLDEDILDKINGYHFVKYIPFLSREDLIKEYRKADIYVMPSMTETFGLTYAEAMTQGLPVIYTKGQGFDKQFEEGVVGYSVDGKDIFDIKSRILDIKRNYKDISYNSYKLCDKFNWEDITKEYMDIYSNVKYANKK
ncbi:glycosyltransferase family 4 protein [Pontibacillus sp. ALD_SL1]|uniref:glycosyltransferase family 4 protein n=1 Tax=Pontibacillus sp. ALD_SL1 TaxID=2777185 RepID=UPI001A969ED8|nr:glycosyltransferase family 4 protein [Pontibacillus sp. ALD_SL1]QSS99781.1 glycosyltransferase family 4 protein [Pontibacillus sp. ALD_SL1]